MNNQKLKGDIVQAAYQVSTNIKDTVARNVVKAVTNKDVVVPREYMQKLVYLIQASVDSAFESSLKEFQKSIDKAVQEEPSKKK